VKKRELLAEVKEAKEKTGYRKPNREHPGAPSGGTGGGRKLEKIVIASILGRTTVKLFKKTDKRLKRGESPARARNLADMPYGTRELANGVVEHFMIVEDASGDWKLVVETKRAGEEE
jgi:hypothetical protein